MNKYKKAFTLVELIVVITILAILGTIAFISLQGYSQNARDSVRISDISKIKTSLELFQLNAGKYPETTTPTTITYSGTIAWTQGMFGEATFNNVTKLDKIPLDPVTDRQYVYSVTNTKQEYQLAGIMEGDEVTGLLNKTNASLKITMLKISGNYNGKVLKISTGGIDYILAIPSIITSSGVTVENIVSNKLLAYNGYKNLPAQYAGSSYDVLGDSGINLINNSNLVVYSGSLATLSDTTSVGIDARKNMIIKLQNAYTGTAITSVGEIAQIINTQTTNSTATEALSTTIVSNNLGGSITASSGGGQTATNSCKDSSKPTDNGHITFTVGIPTSVNQDYLKDAINCGYTCKDGYTGTSCEILPVQFLSNCTANGQIYYVDNSGNKLATVTNTGEATWVSGKSITDLTCAGHIIVCNNNNAGYILQACNAGANTLYTDQTFSSSTVVRDSTLNSWAGGLYQWGNKADISYVSASTSRPTCTDVDSTFSQATFIKGNTDWCSATTDNVWGNTTNTNIARIGPCPTNYHVPTNTEWVGINTAGGWGTTLWTELSNTLKLPYAGARTWGDSMIGQNGYGYYWSSSINGANAFQMIFYSGVVNPSNINFRAHGFSVRCFKN